MSLFKKIFSVIFVLFFLQACSGIKVSEDYEQGYDFTKLKTFSWKENSKNEYGINDNDLMDQRIRTAILDNFTAKSYKLVDTKDPDFYISYHVSIKQKVDSSNVSTGFSFGVGSHGSRSSIGISSGSRVETYNEGTILVDVTDSKTNKLIWRGISTQKVSDHSDVGESTKKVNETIKKMLDLFPPTEK